MEPPPSFLVFILLRQSKIDIHCLDSPELAKQDDYANFVSIKGCHTYTADRLAQLVERRTTEREVSGSSLRPDQHSGS